MNELKRSMIYQAYQTYKSIHPCGKNTSLDDCFTQVDDTVMFWFNTDDQSTHMVAQTCESNCNA